MTIDRNATAKNGDQWTGEKRAGFYLYQDRTGRRYESREVPLYRIRIERGWAEGITILAKAEGRAA